MTPNVAIITPYFQTPPEWMRQCHESVLAQTARVRHVLVCDGCEPYRGPFSGVHVVLPRNYADYGNTPRTIGAAVALQRGADVLAYLDADNWYLPDHIERLLAFAQQSDCEVASSGRVLYRLDGSRLGPCPHVDGERFIDTNCLLLRGRGLELATYWVVCPQDQAGRGDQFVWQVALTRGLHHAHSGAPTVAYRTRHAVHYRLAGEEPPPEAIERRDMSGTRYI